MFMHHSTSSFARSDRQRLLAGCDIRVRLIVAVTAIVAMVVSTQHLVRIDRAGVLAWSAWPRMRTPPKVLLQPAAGTAGNWRPSCC